MARKTNRRLVDFHIHSNFSDGQLAIHEIVDLYGTKGFSAIAITDHLTDSVTLTGQISRKFNLSLQESTFDVYLKTIKYEAERAYRKYKMQLFSGVEITLNSWSRSKGAHLVLLNIDRYINPNQYIDDILLNEKNVFKIAAHPLWEKSLEFKTTYFWENKEKYSKNFDVWECGTGAFFSENIYSSGLSVMANSDFHGSIYKPCWRTQVYSDNLDFEDLAFAIKNKNCEPIWI